MTQDELNNKLLSLIQQLAQQDALTLTVLEVAINEIKNLAEVQLELLKKSR